MEPEGAPTSKVIFFRDSAYEFNLCLSYHGSQKQPRMQVESRILKARSRK